MQRLALFDLDNTLIDLDTAFSAWAAEFADDHHLGAEATEWLIKLDRSELPHREAFFAAVRDHFRLTSPVEDLWGSYRRRMPYLVRCRREVLDGLSHLRSKGWRVGIITNGTADNQLGKIQHTGLGDVVDGWALSGAEGIRKPDVGLFEIAAKRCGALLGDGGWMVGDSLVKDVAGGRAAGLKTVWINRSGRSCSEDAPDHVVPDVLDALSLLSTEFYAYATPAWQSNQAGGAEDLRQSGRGAPGASTGSPATGGPVS